MKFYSIDDEIGKNETLDASAKSTSGRFHNLTDRPVPYSESISTARLGGTIIAQFGNRQRHRIVHRVAV